MGAFIAGKMHKVAAWLLHIGIPRAVILTTIFVTLVSTTMSMTINILKQEFYPITDWLLPSALVSTLVTPVVSYAFLSLAGALAETKDSLHRAATTDALTGAYNRHEFFSSNMAQKLETSPVGILMLDIDNFKTINDIGGHAAGDAVLVAVTRLCRSRLRDSDRFYRWGGEEFLAVLPRTDLDGSVRAAENLRQAVAEMPSLNPAFAVTVSIGVAVSSPGTGSFEELLREADKELYRAKNAGRNRVMHAAEKPGNETGSDPEAAQRRSFRAAPPA